MTSDPSPPDKPQPEDLEDELESSPLASRLRNMTWPEAPSDVKQRVLERILAEHPGIGHPNGDDPK